MLKQSKKKLGWTIIVIFLALNLIGIKSLLAKKSYSGYFKTDQTGTHYFRHDKELKNKWFNFGHKKRGYADANGIVKTSQFYESNLSKNRYYFNKKHAQVYGPTWLYRYGNKYRIGADGIVYTRKTFKVGHKIYYSDQGGKITTNHWDKHIKPLQKNNSYYGRGLKTRYQSKKTNNGILYATMDHGPDESYKVNLPIYVSKNNGHSWQKQGEIKGTTNGYNSVNQPSLYELPENIGHLKKGTLLIAANQNYGLSKHGNKLKFNKKKGTNIKLFKSTDQGRTWQTVSQIAHGSIPQMSKNPVWEPYLKVIHHRLVVFYSDERTINPGQKLVYQASFNGKQWGPIVDVVYDTGDNRSRPGMVTVSKMKNGQYIMAYEYWTSVNGKWSSFTNYKISSDGLDWDPTNLGIQLDFKTASPYIATLSDGTLILDNYKMGSAGLGYTYVNKKNGAVNAWKKIKIPMPDAASRSITNLGHHKVLFVSGGDNENFLRNSGTTLVYTLPKKDRKAK